MIFRPQQKRQSEQRKLLESLGAGDEIISAGGLVGGIVKCRDDFIRVALADNVEITLQRIYYQDFAERDDEIAGLMFDFILV